MLSSKSGYLKPTLIGIKYQGKPKPRLFTRFRCRGETNPLIQKGSYTRTKFWSSSITSMKPKLKWVFWKKSIPIPTNFLRFIVHGQLVHNHLCHFLTFFLMLIRLFIASLFQASSSLLHVHKLTRVANHDGYTICLRYVVHQLDFDLLLIVMLFMITLILVIFITMKLTFSFFFVFGNGHGGSVHMTSGGNKFITFIIITIMGTICSFSNKLLLILSLIMMFSL